MTKFFEKSLKSNLRPIWAVLLKFEKKKHFIGKEDSASI